MTSVRTKRLLLDPVTPRSAIVLWRLMQSAHLREYQDVPRYTRDEFARRVASRPTRLDGGAGRFEWLIREGDGETPIGWVSLRVGDHAHGVGEIGYSVLAPHRGCGYASEAVRAVVALAFERAGLRRVDACCLPANEPSRRLLVRLGFAAPKLQRAGAIVRGRPVDVLVFELTRESWRAPRRDRPQPETPHPLRAAAKPR
ncbi:MAG: GNAT family N-acetyltransferase [Candidatus Baltobacteraceae bacterium]|jgi:RimJ/RimL family protein N-acetyltransferase